MPDAEFEQQEKQIKVLLVEDDLTLRKLLARVISKAGYFIFETDNRVSALSLLENNPDIAIMLVDLGLPPLPHTTAEGLAMIRDTTSLQINAKIIVLTGQDQEQAALEAIREGAFDFLSKPAESEEILAAIKRALLFHRKEQDLATEGVTRLQLNAKISDGLKAVREEAEEKLIRQVLKETGFNVYKSAGQLGVKRESIYYFMKKFGIQRDDG